MAEAEMLTQEINRYINEKNVFLQTVQYLLI